MSKIQALITDEEWGQLNPIARKQKEYDYMRENSGILFSPKEREELRDSIREEIKHLNMSIRTEICVMDAHLKLIEPMWDKIKDIQDRLTTIESSLLKTEIIK